MIWSKKTKEKAHDKVDEQIELIRKKRAELFKALLEQGVKTKEDDDGLC